MTCSNTLPSVAVQRSIMLAMPFSLPAGVVAYCEATYNPQADATTAGLGVYLHDPIRKIKIFVSAISTDISSVLQAEAQGLLLAVRVAKLMGWTSVCFLSDNKTFVDAASSEDLLSKTIHRSIRPTLADIHSHRRTNGDLVLKVPRAENKTAHALAKLAFRDRSDARSSFRCKSNLPFPSLCSTRNKLCNFRDNFVRLLAVYCLGCSFSLLFGRHQAPRCLDE